MLLFVQCMVRGLGSDCVIVHKVKYEFVLFTFHCVMGTFLYRIHCGNSIMYTITQSCHVIHGQLLPPTHIHIYTFHTHPSIHILHPPTLQVDQMLRGAPVDNAGNFDYQAFTRILKHGTKDE